MTATAGEVRQRPLRLRVAVRRSSARRCAALQLTSDAYVLAGGTAGDAATSTSRHCSCAWDAIQFTSLRFGFGSVRSLQRSSWVMMMVRRWR